MAKPQQRQFQIYPSGALVLRSCFLFGKIDVQLASKFWLDRICNTSIHVFNQGHIGAARLTEGGEMSKPRVFVDNVVMSISKGEECILWCCFFLVNFVIVTHFGASWKVASTRMSLRCIGTCQFWHGRPPSRHFRVDWVQTFEWSFSGT